MMKNIVILLLLFNNLNYCYSQKDIQLYSKTYSLDYYFNSCKINSVENFFHSIEFKSDSTFSYKLFYYLQSGWGQMNDTISIEIIRVKGRYLLNKNDIYLVTNSDENTKIKDFFERIGLSHIMNPIDGKYTLTKEGLKYKNKCSTLFFNKIMFVEDLSGNFNCNFKYKARVKTECEKYIYIHFCRQLLQPNNIDEDKSIQIFNKESYK